MYRGITYIKGCQNENQNPNSLIFPVPNMAGADITASQQSWCHSISRTLNTVGHQYTFQCQRKTYVASKLEGTLQKT
jgi:hypothetical protein